MKKSSDQKNALKKLTNSRRTEFTYRRCISLW